MVGEIGFKPIHPEEPILQTGAAHQSLRLSQRILKLQNFKLLDTLNKWWLCPDFNWGFLAENQVS